MIDAGLDIESEQFVPEADNGHELFWTRKPVDPTSPTSETAGHAAAQGPGKVVPVSGLMGLV